MSASWSEVLPPADRGTRRRVPRLVRFLQVSIGVAVAYHGANLVPGHRLPLLDWHLR